MSETQKKLALVTGASSGVGVDFARELAQRGFDLIISGRREEPLFSLREELQNTHGIQVEVIVADLGTKSGAKQLFDDVQKLGQSVFVLINNAGLGHFGMFLDQQIEEMENAIQVNVTSLTILTRLFAAEMSREGGGYILNHASFSAIQPPPEYAVYSGTKSYVMSFSLALRENLKPDKVVVSALCPGFFDSGFLDRAGHKPGFFVSMLTMKQAKIAKAGVRGLLKRKALIIPGVKFKCFNLLMRFLPRTVITGIAKIAVNK